MLLLTDRLNAGLKLQQALGMQRSLTVLGLHQALQHAPANDLVVCDVALDNLASVELLRAALAHHRTPADVPLLCLARDPSHLTATQCKALGAHKVLSSHLPPSHVMAAIKLLTTAPPEDDPAQSSGRKMRETVQEIGSTITVLFRTATQRQEISSATLERGSDLVLAAVSQARMRAWLDVVWSYDDATYQHCLLVAGLVAAFAIELGLSRPSQRLLSQAALVHDIGKSRTPRDILNKPGRLTAAEQAIMQQHPMAGFDMLAGQAHLDPRLADVVRHHHEYLDGSGYPDRLQGNQVSQFVRLVTICDIYAALVERRPYKAPTPPDEAYAQLVSLGAKLDTGLVRAFHAISHKI